MPKVRVVRHEVVQPQDLSYRIVPLTQGQNALVDVADYDFVKQWNWCASASRDGRFYAQRTLIPGSKHKKFIKLFMHRALLANCEGMEIDHRNHNTLDNRRSNLRICTRGENAHNLRKPRTNVSGYKGVSVSKYTGRWDVRIRIPGKYLFLGTFDDPRQGALAYDEAARLYFGSFACLNFPEVLE